MAAKQAKVSGAAELALRWSNDSRWQGISRQYTAEDVVALRGRYPVVHTLAELGAERLWELLHAARADHGARRRHRRPGRADGSWRASGDLPLRLAGGGRGESRRPHLPGSKPLPGKQRAGARAAAQQRPAARRPDRRGRGQRRHPLARADRRRRRGGIRRGAERLRADEVDDRGGRLGRALRGSARGREEMRASRRQGARPDEPVRSHACSRRGSLRTSSTCRPCSSPAPTR